MKRFITYLYEYENGQKIKNTGFVRVEERKGRVILQISVRNFIRSHEKGKIYLYIRGNELRGIPMGELVVLNNQTDISVEFESNNICNTEVRLEQVIGIAIVFPKNGYMASCWNDDYAEAIAGGQLRVWERNEIELHRTDTNVLQEVETGEKEEIVQHKEMKEQEVELEQMERNRTYDLTTYQKMELNAIKNLPSPNWYLCNNRFLVHGFFNYGYLVLKKTTEADVEKLYLGVPGIYEKPEVVMATMFGFEEFQALPQEASKAKMEEVITVSDNPLCFSPMKKMPQKEKEPKMGTFGCWLIPVLNS